MRYLLGVMIFLISCNENEACKRLQEQSKQLVADFYKREYHDSLNFTYKNWNWGKIISGACDHVNNTDTLVVLQQYGHSTAPEGLVYVKNKDIYFYFKFNGQKMTFSQRSSELSNLKALITNVKDDFPQKAMNILAYSKVNKIEGGLNYELMYLIPANTKASSFLNFQNYPPLKQ